MNSIEFSWLTKGNKKHKEWDNTVLGHINIKENKMTVEVNSVNRADLFEAEMQRLKPSGWRLISKVIEPVEQHLKNAQSTGPKSQAGPNDLNSHPEVQAAISKMMEKHWDNWIHDKIPALGNKTPLEAMKTASGREALDALLNQFERDAEVRPMPGQTVATFEALRQRLGL